MDKGDEIDDRAPSTSVTQKSPAESIGDYTGTSALTFDLNLTNRRLISAAERHEILLCHKPQLKAAPQNVHIHN